MTRRTISESISPTSSRILARDRSSPSYRHLPNDRSGRNGSLQKGGALQMLAVEGAPQPQSFRSGALGGRV